LKLTWGNLHKLVKTLVVLGGCY